jgi:iron complex outermembrane receptor protein
MTKHFTKKLILLLSMLFLGYAAAFAQGDVTGKVTDEADGQPLAGVTVLVKGTMTGTTTDMDGKYKIQVKPGDFLVFSFIGYETQEIGVQPNTVVNVSMAMKAEFLEELVIIGYGVQKKSDATGSVAAIGTKDFNKGGITTAPQLAVGKIPGVQITSVGGAPGEGSVIRIRRGSSLSASNDPLYVIDGVPVDNDGISGTRNALSTLNPNDIETFTVLKDASAAAIYGNRASNGVIIITTKKGALGKDGAKGKTINLEYNGTFSLYTVPKTVDVLGADEFRTLMNERYAGNETVLRMMGDANTDWQDEIYRNAFGMDHYIGASGAIKWMPYRFSIGYTDEDGVLETDNMKRTTLGLSLTPSLFDDHLKINLNAKGIFVKNHFADQGAIGSAMQYDPTQPVTADSLNYYDSETEQPIYFANPYGGYYTWIQTYNQDPVSQGSSNPVALLNMRDDNSDVKRLLGNVQLDYKLHFFPDLRLNLNLGMDHSWSDGTVYVPDYAGWEYDPVNGGGLNTVYDQEKKNDILECYGNYVKDVKAINSSFNVMAGYSWQHFYRESSNYSTNIAGTLENDSSILRTESYIVSLYGRLIYGFKNRYLATLTIRNDNTSRFSPDTRAGYFPSVALAWKINDEPWMAGLENLSQLKLRLGWGVTGQQNLSDNDYPYINSYTYSEPNAAYQFGNYYYVTLRPEGYDDGIKWEETTTYNIGLDYGFLGDRIYGSLDFYYRETEDMLNFIPVPAGSNLTNYILTNVGNMKNNGVEFAIFTKPVVTKDWQWDLNFNCTYSYNEITKLTATEDTNYLGVLTGGISGGVGNTVQIQSIGFPSNSYFVYEQVYDADGNPIEDMFVDRNGDGEVTDEDRYQYKDANPKFYFGVSSTLTYKNFDFFFAGRANFGNYVYNNVSSENGVYERLYRAEGPYLGNITSDVYDVDFVAPRYLSDYYIQDGSFFKMDVISLSYLFDNLVKDKLNLRVTATVNNAFTITNYTGIDPEINSGIDNRIYPRPRVYALGINLTF